MDRFFTAVFGRPRRLDILVNNAALEQHVAAVVSLSDGEWARVLSVTLTRTFYCRRAAGRIMES